MSRTGEAVHGRVSYYQKRILAGLIRTINSFSSGAEQKRQAARIPASVTKTHITIPSRNTGRSIKVDVYTPANIRNRPDGKKAVHVNFHGSGFMIEGLGDDTEFCARLAEATNCVVFDCNYRKSPEYPYPLPQEDGEDICAYLKTSAEHSSANISVSGFSAGASLAMGIARRLGPNTVNALVIFYGNSDMTQDYIAPNTVSEAGVTIPVPVRRFLYNSYIGPEFKRDHPDFSPLLAVSSEFPRHVLAIFGDCDQLHEPGKLLIDKLQKDGIVDATFYSVEKAAHSFDKKVQEGTAGWEKKEQAYSMAFDFVRRAWDSAS